VQQLRVGLVDEVAGSVALDVAASDEQPDLDGAVREHLPGGVESLHGVLRDGVVRHAVEVLGCPGGAVDDEAPHLAAGA
jgi:hypothetical protein